MQGLTRRDILASGSLGFALAVAGPGPLFAQDRSRTLRYVTPDAFNSLDPVAFGATVESTYMSCGIYDRLVRFGTKQVGDFPVFDMNKIEGQLAERFEVSSDGKTLTFYLRDGSVWHDGSPVTASDIKWSLERATKAETMSRAQMETGSITADAVFEVVDPKTIKITLPAADRLAVANLTTLYAPMMNAELIKKSAGPNDPWGIQWLKANSAGGGAFMIEKFKSGELLLLKRNDAWKSGKLPYMERVIVQNVPTASARRNLVERGDADATDRLQIADFVSLAQEKKIAVASIPMPTAFVGLIFNTRLAPFDNVKVRQAITAAVPYDDLIKSAVLGQGGKLYGADWTDTPPTGSFPQPMPNRTDLDAAKKLLAEAGHPDGFATTLAYGANRAEWADLAAPLLQEALGKIGITVKIEKMGDPQFAEGLTKKTIPMFIERSISYFPAADYFFRVFLSGEQRWNFSSWKNPRVDELLPVMRHETDTAKYDAMSKELIAILQREQPMTLLWAPNLQVAMASNLTGFTVWPGYFVDYRDFSRKS